MSRAYRTLGASTAANRVPALILFALFIMVLLLALVAGVGAYSKLIGERNDTDESRFAHGLVLNSVIGANSFDSVQIGRGPEGDALVLVEQTVAGSFETRIYEYKGDVLQEYTLAGNAYDPDSATKLLKSDTFNFTLNDGLLSVSTDEGLTEVAVRAGSRGVL